MALTGDTEHSRCAQPFSGVRELAFCLWYARLLRQPGLDHAWLRRLLEVEGRAVDPDRIQPQLSLPIGDMQLDHPDSCLEEARRLVDQQINALCLGDPDFPVRLRQISGCPPILFYRGTEPAIKLNQPQAITVIGTRNPSLYGQMVTRHIVKDLVRPGLAVISGLARGIDALAHQVTLEHHGLTIAVVAHGVDRIYPAQNRDLMDQIAKTGLIVSEHLPGTPPLRSYFPARNRILSGLADLVAVTEASRQSGTMITASFAADQGRDVMAVPGSILLGKSDGCHQLLREGAGLLECAADILQTVRAGYGHLENQPVEPADTDQDALSTGRDRQNACSASPDADSSTAICGTHPSGQEQKTASCSHSARRSGQWLPDQEDCRRLRHMAGSALTLPELAGLLGCSLSDTARWLGLQELAGRIIRERGRYVLTESGFFCI